MAMPTAKSTVEVAGTQNFNLIILRDASSEILLSRRGGSFTLPQITIPIRQRTAKCISEQVLDAWHLRAICLFQAEGENSTQEANENQYMLLESRDLAWRPPDGFDWISRDKLHTALDLAGEARAVQDILRRADAYNNGTVPGPFARFGWIDELLLWAEEPLGFHNLQLTGSFRQFNCGPSFTLIQLETNHLPVWFKAVGEPNLREYCITIGLAHDHPRYLPAVIATKPEWNGWLMLDAGGKRFDDGPKLEHWQDVAETLARLQLECLKEPERLLEIGCKDRRMAKTIEQIDPFLDTVNALMREQPCEPPQRLNQPELERLGTSLKDACRCLEHADIPDSILHGDFNPGNVLVGPNSCFFLDWAEGCIGPPFLTFEHLIAHLYRLDYGNSHSEQELRRVYARCWADVLSNEQISQAMIVAPLIAVLWHALGSAVWQESRFMREGRIAKYLRSMARRMQKESEKIRESGMILA